MAGGAQGPAGPQPARGSAFGSKKNSAGILEQFQQLWAGCDGFQQRRSAEKALNLALSSLLCPGRHTITGWLTTAGAAFCDWSAAYRIFAAERISMKAMFAGIRRQVCQPDQELLAVLDDTLLAKSGTKIAGVRWRRDPLGPHFQDNLIRAQRFLQISMQPSPASGLTTLVPVDFIHAPGLPKPGRYLSGTQLEQHRRAQREMSLPNVASCRLLELRQALDQQNCQQTLLVAVDGGYTNRTLFGSFPERTTLIGRLRKDAKLFYRPQPSVGAGRPRRYGAPAPTPEHLRTDDQTPWTTVTMQHDGAARELRYKRLQNVLWRKTGVQRPVQILVLAPLAYRPKQGARLCYRKPGFLICTDPELPPSKVIAAYLQRWAIECNFRDEKSLLGVGEAQVRNPHSAESVPAFAVANYALLLLAAGRAFPQSCRPGWPPPKWRRHLPAPKRFSVSQALSQLRAEVWGRGLGLDHFAHFAAHATDTTKSPKSIPPVASAVIYAN